MVRTADGSRGWPDKAPYDAILAAAGGPRVPQAFKDQLTIGGRLVMPVGNARSQQLVRLTRTAADAWEQDTLEEVRFVPLIGAEAWPDAEADNGAAEMAAPATMLKP